MNESHEKKAGILKALGHPIRYCIVEGLVSGEQIVGSMVACTGVPQPTVSQHLNVLKAAGVIECRREGNKVYYDVCDPMVREIVKLLKE